MKDIKLPAIIVADGRLGSINRAVLTCEYAKLHGIEVKAIIVNDTTAVEPVFIENKCGRYGALHRCSCSSCGAAIPRTGYSQGSTWLGSLLY